MQVPPDVGPISVSTEVFGGDRPIYGDHADGAAPSSEQEDALVRDCNVISLGASRRQPRPIHHPEPGPRKLSALVAPTALLAGDVGGFLTAWVALAPLAVGEGHIGRLLGLAALATIAVHWSENLYPGYRLQAHEQLRRRVIAALKVGATGALCAGVLLDSWWSALLMASFLALALAVQLIMDGPVRALVRRTGFWGERAVVLGEPVRVVAVEAYLAQNWQCGLLPEPIGVWAEHGAPPVALIAGPPPAPDALARLHQSYADVVLLADLSGVRISGLSPADLRGELGVRLGANARPDTGRRLNRIVDLAVAVPAAILLSPAMMVAAAVIYATDPGPVIYRQTREGLGGRRFEVFKLRTMYLDADIRLEAVLRDDPAAQAEWSRHFKLRRDPRILPLVGKTLRSTSIDELPQLFNVIAGHMRIVGPRPFPLYHLAAMEAKFRSKRCSILPGLTGLWQISERSEADIDRQQLLDDFYIDNRSIWLDLHILLNTASAVLRGRGAY